MNFEAKISFRCFLSLLFHYDLSNYIFMQYDVWILKPEKRLRSHIRFCVSSLFFSRYVFLFNEFFKFWSERKALDLKICVSYWFYIFMKLNILILKPKESFRLTEYYSSGLTLDGVATHFKCIFLFSHRILKPK